MKKISRRSFITAMAAVSAAGVLAACGSSSSSTASSVASSAVSSEATSSAASMDETGTHTVVDHGGNEVEVPNKVTRVVIDQIPILSTYMAYFEGSAPYIVGYCGSFKSVISDTVLKNIAPELLESSDTVYAQSDLNIEEIMKLNPDVILYNAGNSSHAEILKASGIPSIGFATVGASTEADPIERYEEWLKLLEQIFNEPGKTEAFVAAGDEIVADVEARITEIPQTDRPSALILWKYADGVPQVSGQGTFGTYWMKRLGVTDKALEATGFAQASMEQIYSWDPDILFLDGPGLQPLRTEDVLSGNVDGADFSTLTAVKSGRVYNTTLGMWNWFTPNPDAPLVLAWLACNTYPDAFADYPLGDTIKEYYKTWYGYDVTDDELEEILCFGRMNVPVGEVLTALRTALTGESTSNVQNYSIVINLRLPRILMAIIVGAGLSCAGNTYQSLFSNPLATPDILGVTSGTCVGAILAIILSCSILETQLIALVFGLISVCFTLKIAGKSDGRSMVYLVLAGTIASSLFNALGSLLKYTADPQDKLPEITYWLLGSFTSASYQKILIGCPLIVAGIIIIYLLRWRLNILSLSDDEARASGINIKQTRMLFIVASTLVTASAVSMCGQVGWIGLLIPHASRMLVGSNNRYVVPLSLSLGASFMILIDTLSRSISIIELPLSILTAIIGAPAFISLLNKTRSNLQ